MKINSMKRKVTHVGLGYQLMCYFALVVYVNSQNDTTSPAESPFESTTTLADVVKCGNTKKMVDECFKDLPPHLMEFLQSNKIVVTEQEIASKCTVFHRGMSCFEDYISRCLSSTSIKDIKNNVEGARKFFIKFCNNREFQKDYLRHKDCFSHIKDDWVRCTTKFQNILTEELHVEHSNVTKKFMEFCCARHAYENCIYKSARYKCYQQSAKFARDTAKMLSEEKHFSNCREYEDLLCTSDATTTMLWHKGQRQFLLFLLLLWMLYG